MKRESGPAKQGNKPLSADELRKLHAWWSACNYLAVGMIGGLQ